MQFLKQVNQVKLLVKKYINHTTRTIVKVKGPVCKGKKGNKDKTPIIPLSEGKRFIREVLEAVGTPTEHAKAQADLLIEADYRGHFSHGMNRLELYTEDIKACTCYPEALPEIEKENSCTAWVNGQFGLGAVVGNFCMDLAMQKAKESGVGWVCAHHSNHYGIAGWYILQAVKQRLIGLSFTNTSPLMTPTGGIDAALGTNAIAFAAPAKGKDCFVLDMATTEAAVGKIEIQMRKNEPIPKGWALDKEGKVTTDAVTAFNAGHLMPFAGFKGFALGLMSEVLCGILSGSCYGPKIRPWTDHKQLADLGQCFIALDPECFAPGFEERMSDIMDTIRNMRPADPKKPILVAGDPERLHMKKVDQEGGVQYVQNQIDTCAKVGKEYNVEPPKPKS